MSTFNLMFPLYMILELWIKYIDWRWQWENIIKSVQLANCGEIISKSNKSVVNCEQRVKKLTLKHIYSMRTHDECDFKAGFDETC